MDKEILKSAGVLIDLACAEDVGQGDITTNNLIPVGERRTAAMVAKEAGIVAGLPVAELVFRRFDKDILWDVKKPDGSKIVPGDIIVEFKGNYRALLTGERIALNFLQHLSGVATYANNCSEAVKGCKVEILDTRKTLPGFRLLEKYAVKVGGASNHRIGLFDMVLIKDNHIRVAGGIKKAVDEIKARVSNRVKVEVETTNLNQVREALGAGADIIMLDNMSLAQMAKAVKFIGGKVKTEASGNMTLKRLPQVAKTGVDYISVGALTHSVAALDISQKIAD
jgi:nicotinate-nucleotide pyrophosphorylase (carboxylating)